MCVSEIRITHFFSFSFCFLALLVGCRLQIQLHLPKWSRFPECPWCCSCSCPSWVLQKLRLIQVTQPLLSWKLNTRCLPTPVSGHFRERSAKGTHSVSFHPRDEPRPSQKQKVVSIPCPHRTCWVFSKCCYVDQRSSNTFLFLSGRRNGYLLLCLLEEMGESV